MLEKGDVIPQSSRDDGSDIVVSKETCKYKKECGEKDPEQNDYQSRKVQ